MSTKKDNRLIFEIKNSNRKRYFTQSTDPEKYTARKLRKFNNGAFGRLKAHDAKNYNKMTIGTSLGSKM
jgi:DNA modification methylase